MCSSNMTRHAQCNMTCNFVQRLLNWLSGHRTWTPTGRNHFSRPAVLKPKNERIKPNYVLFLFRTNINFKFEWVSESCSVMSNFLRPHGLYSPWNSPGQNTGVGNLFLLQGSSQPRDQTQVSHFAGRFFTSWATGKPKNSWKPRNQTGVSCIAGGFFTNRAMREAPISSLICFISLITVFQWEWFTLKEFFYQ